MTGRGFGTTCVLSGIAALVAAAPASAATFQVTKAGDSNPNGCSQGGCTLREATIAANNQNGADAIVLAGGRTYKLDIPGAGDDESQTGDLDLTERATVRAAGGGTARVDGAGVNDGIFDTFASARFEGLELTGASGEAIRGESDIAVERSVIRKPAGVAVRSDGGDVTLQRSKIVEPSSNAVYQSQGGGVSVKDSALVEVGSTGISEYDGGSVQLERTTVNETSSNVVYESGEGNIEVAKSKVRKSGSTGFGEYEGGSVTITGSKLEGFGSNVVYESSEGNIRLAGSDVERTKSTAFGEYDQGNVTITNSDAERSSSNMVYESGDGSVDLKRASLADAGATIVGEYDTGGVQMSRTRLEEGPSNGVYEAGEGGVELSASRISRTDYIGVQETDLGDVSLRRSSVTRSNAYGVLSSEGDITVKDSTLERHVSGGLSVGAAAGAVVEGSTIANSGQLGQSGGGIVSSGALFVENSTIYGNTATEGGGVYIPSGTAEFNAVTITRNTADTVGGGIRTSPAGVEVRNSLVADNVAGFFGPDCYASASFTSGGHNLLSDDDFCTGLGAGSDKVKANAQTGSLKHNGGPTRTAAIGANSPAVDNAGNSAPARDQRGRTRDSKPDIGAFER